MNEASSSSTFPEELEDMIQEEKVTFYTNDFRLEPELYNYYQQIDHRAVDVPLQGPMIDYQSSGVNNNHGAILQQPFTPDMKHSDWRYEQNSRVMENPKKRMNNVRDQKVVNKKHASHNKMQGIEGVTERVPMRRSQKLADKITALQKLVSPYGKTDTASVLQEAHISINLLHGQIQKLLQSTQTPAINIGPIQNRNNKEAESSLRDKGLCLVPVSTLQVNSIYHGEQNFISGNY
ncbi:transcription factor bHLH114 [Artemisia annua]|uniref:Transcription factor bHLH114 n=1 Tax=Artemisia annua TaxID=35608 RepID=A0A2U1PXD3_ARTAN|nr:transcription factor bHLH114 [Artemisia annua]